MQFFKTSVSTGSSSSSSSSSVPSSVLSSLPLFGTLCVFIVGAVLGVFASFTVNCTLVEISINPFFAFYFGLIFLLIGGVVLWRVYVGDHPQPIVLSVFSISILTSGFMCFFLEDAWFTKLSPMTKVPIYSLLGLAVTFALLFSLIDILNYCTSECSCCGLFSWLPALFGGSDGSSACSPIIQSEQQIYLLLFTSSIMGLTFGLIFGLLDIEDEMISHLKVALLREESICYPIGAILGGLAAVVNFYLKKTQEKILYNPVHGDDLDEEI